MRERNAVAVTLFTVVEGCDRAASEEFLVRVAESFPGAELTRKVVEGKDIAKAILERRRTTTT
jgi:hypothetical protein